MFLFSPRISRIVRIYKNTPTPTQTSRLPFADRHSEWVGVCGTPHLTPPPASPQKSNSHPFYEPYPWILAKIIPRWWVYGGVLGWVLEKHPPFNFSLFIVVLSDMGGCWGVFASQNFFALIIVKAHTYARYALRMTRKVLTTAKRETECRNSALLLWRAVLKKSSTELIQLKHSITWT